MRKMMAAALAASTFVASAPAMAATNIPLSETGAGVFTGTFNSTVSTAGSFTDRFEFTVPWAGSIGASLITLTFDGALQFTSVLLNNTVLTLTSADRQSTATLPGSILSGANPQRLVVNGTLAGDTSGTYSGNIRFQATPPVPEPATWALMILGFGVVGYAMRRRPNVRFVQAI